MKRNNICKLIRQYWFERHSAQYKKQEQTEIIDWFCPDSNIYSFKYILNIDRLDIIGYNDKAVLKFAKEITIEDLSEMSLLKFYKSIITYSKDLINFSMDKVNIYLDWNIKDSPKNKNVKNLTNVYKEIKQLCQDKKCIDKKEWLKILDTKKDLISKNQYKELSDIGDEIPIKIIGYYLGLQMAIKQIC